MALGSRKALEDLRRRRRGECLRKRAYQSEDHAKRVAVTRWLVSGVRLRVYTCPHCGGWHLTKMVDVSTRDVGFRSTGR